MFAMTQLKSQSDPGAGGDAASITARLQASDFDPEVLRLFDAYVHGALDRRGFLERAARFAVAGGTALGLLEALSPRFAAAAQIKADDPRLVLEHVELDSPKGYAKARGYLARPAKPRGPLPAVLVVHENRGLNPHIEDVARRLALENFLVLAPDALFPLGGYPGDEDKARALFSELDQQKTHEDFVASAGFLRRHAQSNGKLGVVGFCYGGGIAVLLATRLPDLNAAVPFYGRPTAPETAAQIKAPLLVHLAEQDDRVNGEWPAFEAALKTSGAKFELHKYPGTQHGFNNDTTPRYDPNAAKLAWQRTLAFFEKNLRAAPPKPGAKTKKT
jgi:carboxymethylenebutenolidase